MTDEPTYTLEQAEQILLDRQCAMSQHHLVPLPGSVGRMRCAVCTRTFDLVPVAEGA